MGGWEERCSKRWGKRVGGWVGGREERLSYVPVDELGPLSLQVRGDAAQGPAFVDGRLYRVGGWVGW